MVPLSSGGREGGGVWLPLTGVGVKSTLNKRAAIFLPSGNSKFSKGTSSEGPLKLAGAMGRGLTQGLGRNPGIPFEETMGMGCGGHSLPEPAR